MLLPAINNLAEICARHGLREVVLSPGSRCAPLTIAFARHPDTRTRTFSDERSAAFVALGMAQVTGKASILVCTSGTAPLNYAPAVAEAFYQQVPLLVLSADRPPEWIDQQDGQTIRQRALYGAHVKGSYELPTDLTHPDAVWFAARQLSEAINLAHAFPPGPVHVNVPLREPFYPAPGEEVVFDPQVKVVEELPNDFSLPAAHAASLGQELQAYEKVLLVAGQLRHDPVLLQAMEKFCAATGAALVGDLISNTHSLAHTVSHPDVIPPMLREEEKIALRPDLLITFGNSTISKNLKLYLRAHPPQAHWHLQAAGPVADPFQSLSRIVRVSPSSFLNEVAGRYATPAAANAPYQLAWAQQEKKAIDFIENFLGGNAFTEFTAFKAVLAHLPAPGNLHVANSMAVRYANLIGLRPHQAVTVYANRGTSGIDGSTSTALGTALSSPLPTTLLTGDMAFFYDRNALWNKYLPPHLRIVMFNNHGGGIFRLIDGPSQQPELDEYFETEQPLTAESTAREFNLNYFTCHSLAELREVLPAFFANQDRGGILEIITDSRENTAFFREYRQALRQ